MYALTVTQEVAPLFQSLGTGKCRNNFYSFLADNLPTWIIALIDALPQDKYVLINSNGEIKGYLGNDGLGVDSQEC